MQRRFDASVVGILLALVLAFSSCTCQRDVPEPPQRSSRLSGSGSWSGLPTPLRDRRDRRDIDRGAGIRREPPPARPVAEEPEPEENVEIPEDFPEDVPVFEDAEVFGVQKLAAGAKNVLFRTEGDIPEVFSYYKDEMSGGGWDVKQEYQQANQSFLSFERDGMITNMTVARDAKTGKQIIAVMYYKQQPLAFEEF